MNGEKLTLTLEAYSSVASISSSYKPENAFDGSTSSYWRTANGESQGAYLIFKLDTPVSLTGFRIYPSTSAYRPESFVLSISNDGVDFTDVYSGSCVATASWAEHDIDSALVGNYIKVTFNGYNTTRLYVYDFEIYGSQVGFKTNGTADFYVGPLTEITSVFSSAIKWYQETPDGTACTVSAKIGDGEYLPCANGAALPGLAVGDDIHDKLITIRVELSTDDTSVTPTFGNLGLVVADQRDSDLIVLHFASGIQNSIQNAVGDVTIAYSGGTLAGLGGPVADFSLDFTPDGLDAKPHQNDVEHINLSASASGDLIRIYYTETLEREHISLSVSATGTLTHIDDL